MDQNRSKVLEKFRNRREFDRKDMAEQGVAVFEDGTRVACIIHDMSEGNENEIFGMRVELLNVPKRDLSKTCVIHMHSGRKIQYTLGWTKAL